MKTIEEEQMDLMAFEMGQTRLRGSRFADKVEDVGRGVVSHFQEASKDQEGWYDDALRLAGGGLKNVAWLAERPGIKQGLQVLGAGGWAGGKLGEAAAQRLGIDPRLGKWTGGFAGDAVTGGLIKKGVQIAKTTKQLSKLSPLESGRLVTGGGFGAAPVGPRTKLGKIKAAATMDKGTREAVEQAAKQSIFDKAPDQLTNIVKSGKDVGKELAKSPNYKALSKKHRYITAEDFANSPNLKKFLYREQVLKKSIARVKDAESSKIKALKVPKDKRGRALKRADKNLKQNRRATLEHASLNLLDDEAKHIFFMNREGLKKGLSEFFAQEGTEWHHLFGNKETGNIFLNEIAQDTMVTVNLMEHMKRLKLKSSGIRQNLTAMVKDPHNELHTMFRKMGLEQGGSLDFADYMQSIAKDVALGKTDVNQFFTMLDTYASHTMPWLKKKAESFGGTEFSKIPMEPYLDKYQGLLEKGMKKVEKEQLDMILFDHR